MGNHCLHLLNEGKDETDNHDAMDELWTDNVDQGRNRPVHLGLDEPSHDCSPHRCPDAPLRLWQPAP